MLEWNRSTENKENCSHLRDFFLHSYSNTLFAYHYSTSNGPSNGLPQLHAASRSYVPPPASICHHYSFRHLRREVQKTYKYGVYLAGALSDFSIRFIRE